MTKKDYIVIARAIKQILKDLNSIDPQDIKDSGTLEILITDTMAEALQKDNPKFSTNKWKETIYGKISDESRLKDNDDKWIKLSKYKVN